MSDWHSRRQSARSSADINVSFVDQIPPNNVAGFDAVTDWAGGKTAVTGVSERISKQVALISAGPTGGGARQWVLCGILAAPPCAIHPSPPADAARPFHLVTARRLEWTKRPKALIHIFAKAQPILTAEGRYLKLTIAGSGRHSRRIERLVKRLGLHQKIAFVGWQTAQQLHDLYDRADACLLPSKLESFGISALEARACGLPIIAYANTGMADFITNKTDGVLCQNDTPLARAIVKRASDAALLLALSGPRPELRRYDWEKTAALHIKAYQQVRST